jgi:hypothetical protein
VHGVGWGSPSPIERRACSSRLPSLYPCLAGLISSHSDFCLLILSPLVCGSLGFYSFFVVFPRFLLSSSFAGN